MSDADEADELDWDLEPPDAGVSPSARVPIAEPDAARGGSIQDILDETTHEDPEDDEALYERKWEDLLGDSLSPGDVLAEKYRVDELIGYGAMGFVIKSWHIQLDEPVAVKFLLPELAKSHEALVRFEREARAAFKIRSEHVARVLDVGRVGSGQPFMVMEYLEGHELGDKMYGQQMRITEIVDYMLQVCDAMVEAHALNIVHRDVKPDNLFLVQRRDGTTSVKVLDFGLSKVVSGTNDAKRQKALTADAQVLGTAHYMSPEQWVASKDVGPAADIWSLGVILYEAVTGESPFMRNNLAAMCNAVLRDEPPGMDTYRDDVPAGFAAVVGRCMAKKPEDRYPSASALADDLLRFASTDTRPPPRFSAPPPAPAAQSVSAMPPGAELMAPSSGVQTKSSALPQLGLRGPNGLFETWADVLETAPDRSRTSPAVYVAVVAIIVIALIYLLT